MAVSCCALLGGCECWCCDGPCAYDTCAHADSCRSVNSGYRQVSALDLHRKAKALIKQLEQVMKFITNRCRWALGLSLFTARFADSDRLGLDVLLARVELQIQIECSKSHCDLPLLT